MNILELREAREQRIGSWITSYGCCVLTIKPNFPGQEKRNFFTNYAVYVIFERLRESFPEAVVKHEFDREGLIFHLLTQGDPKRIKESLIGIESEHPLGRLVDIDVYGTDGVQISREDFGYPRRRCFLCEKPAVLCSRSMAHAKEDIIDYYFKRVREYILSPDTEKLRIVEFSLLNELMRDLSLGTVTPNTTGCHQDMDVYTFFRSLQAISAGISKLREIDTASFSELRAFGLQLERQMFAATGDVNTHKGIIFAFLLILAAVLNVKNPDGIREEIIRLASESLRDLGVRCDTNGLRIYTTHGLKGARGIAATGYREVFDRYIPMLTEDPDPDRLFLTIAHRTEDTNVIHRAGLERYIEYKRLLEQVIQGDLEPEVVEAYCLKHRISAGGSADLLSITILLQWIMDSFDRVKLLI